jgi:hypothetical protein
MGTAERQFKSSARVVCDSGAPLRTGYSPSRRFDRLSGTHKTTEAGSPAAQRATGDFL